LDVVVENHRATEVHPIGWDDDARAIRISMNDALRAAN